MQLWRPELELVDLVRQLVPLLTNKDVSLNMRGGLYGSCVGGGVARE